MRRFSIAYFLVALCVAMSTGSYAAPCADPIFTNTVNVAAPAQYQTGLAFADFNNDGYKDALFSSEASATVSLRLGDGSGNFSGGSDFVVPDHPWGVAAADFNGDGNMDFAVTAPPSGIVTTRFGDGMGGFGPVSPFYFVGGPWNDFLEVADFNNDGHVDILNASNGSSLAAVLLNDGSGSFAVTTFPVGAGSLGVAVGDFNSDGNDDFATANFVAGTISIRLGNGAGGFTTIPDVASGAGTWDVSVGDFDGDAYQDIAATNRLSDSVTIFAGDGTGNLVLSSSTPTTSHPAGIGVADLDNDGIDDVIAVPQDSNELRVFRGDGDGGLSQIASLFVDYNSLVVEVGDLNGDGYIDFGTGNNGGFQAQIRIFLGGCNTPPDETPPTITITQPTNSTYLLNQSVTIEFSCDDEGSGIATCDGSSPNGSALNTSAPGSYSFTVNATDIAGNSSQQVVHYTVGYGIVALYDQTKAHKSGSTVPIKIRLVDASGANVSSASIVVHAIGVMQTSTMASTVLDDAGSSNPDFDFRYDAALGGYIFNLKTTGYTTGSYVLKFIAGGGPAVYSVGFQVRQ